MQLGNEKRGRGRPRKYTSDDGGGENANPPAKRARGRPPGSCNKQLQRGTGRSFTTHTINVNAGEDIATKLAEFMKQEPREVVILSASGVVSSAVLCHNPSGLIKYEGEYGIINMSGSFLNTESNGTVTRTGGLSVHLTRPDGHFVAGFVGGMLVAESQVKVVVGSFVREKVKLSAGNVENNKQSVLSLSGGGGPGSPQSQGSQGSNDINNFNNHQDGNSTPSNQRCICNICTMHDHYLWPGNNPQ